MGVCKNGKAQLYLVHRLVAQAFLPQPADRALVHHINHNRSDPRLDNLAWVDSKTNNSDRGKRTRQASEDIGDLPGEVWKAAEIGSAGEVLVSSCGRVKHGKFADRPQKGTAVGKEGYRQVCILLISGIRKQFKVHRLVAACFIPNTHSLATQVNHISGDKQDNGTDNLEWLSPSANSQHAYDRAGSKRKTRAVVQFDLNGDKIAEFCSVNAACRAFGKKGHNLDDACTGKQKTSGGFIWRYKERTPVDHV